MQQTQYIFVTGGVCSSLGKGIVAASTAAILKSFGKRVSIMKLDPYFNVDPGTMSPFQHGEVFVLDDGGETDLDLGHYERFINHALTSDCSVSSGKIFSEVLAEERSGKHLGGTIQIVPHVTDKLRQKIEHAARQNKAEILVVEIGGTVGDIEGEPFLEVLRQMKHKYGKNLISLHTTLLPYLAASGELKTKPTQLSVKDLRARGIAPDIIFCRADVKIPKKLLKKVAYFCDVDDDAVIPAETVPSIYEIPIRFQKYGLGSILAKKLGISDENCDFQFWEKGLAQMQKAKTEITIGLAGKYNELDDAYLSVIEAIKSAGFFHQKKIKIQWINPEKIEETDPLEIEKMQNVAGIVVPGGFGDRGTSGKILVAKFCREKNVPYLGLCLGSQIMAIEWAQNVLQIKNATSEEFSPKSKNLVVHFLPDQRTIRKKGGTMRLGSYKCILKKGSRAAKIYFPQQKNPEPISERHRHRFEFNNDFRQKFENSGFSISGTSPDGSLAEIVEIPDHKFMIGSQFHPEFLSRPFVPHPLFREFLGACLEK